MTDFMKHLEPTEREYLLNCKILVRDQTYEDEQSMGKLGLMSRKVVLLSLPESSQAYAFLSAWLGVPSKLVECLIRIDHPFHQYARVAIKHPKSQDPESLIEEIHLYLMSYGLTQIILSKPSLHDQELLITTCASGDDHPDGCPTDGEGEGDDLYSGTRREVITGVETKGRIPGNSLVAPANAPDRHGRVFPVLKGSKQ